MCSVNQSNTKLIYVETPSNPLFKITDIHAVATLAKEHKILLAVELVIAAPAIKSLCPPRNLVAL
jgi:cystathionine beta-lyase